MRRTAAALLACLGAFAPAPAADDLCGAAVVANVKLYRDLACSGDGLVAGADGIRIDLNGRTIAGSGAGAGVRISGRTGVTVTGGTIRGFFAGVLVVGSTDVVIKNTVLEENVDGVDCQAGCAGATIKENEFRRNSSRGVMLRGSTVDNVVKENSFDGDRVGILLFGARDTLVKENRLSAALLAAIRVNVFATGNVIVENAVTANPVGIEFLVTPTGSAAGNALVENILTANTCGLKGPAAGNILRENRFEANGSDLCP